MKFSIVKESGKVAIKALLLNKARSFLTMLGIIIGITAVIILISAGQGAQELILSSIKGIGSNLVFVIPGGTGNSKFAPPVATQGIIVTTLTDEDVKALRNRSLAPDIEYASPEVRGQYTVAYNRTDELAAVAGEDENYWIVRNLNLSSGAWFTKPDIDGFSQVAVLGSKIKDNLFGEEDAVGKVIKIKQISFRVVGVIEPKGVGAFGVDQDSQVIVPVKTAQKILLGINHYNLIQVRVTSEDRIPDAIDQINTILRNNHHITDPNKDDFTVRNTQDALALFSTITGVLTLFLTAIAGISLVVGGIGIMNIMLVAVTERTREIGLRKAIGAKRRDILLQFLFEAITLTVLGGIIGVILGSFGAVVIARIGNWSPVIPLSAIFIAVGVAGFFGLVFGIYPANKASKLDPITALRYE